MKQKNFKIMAIIMALGLVAAIVASLFTSIAKEPSIKEHDFNYSVTYKLNGETKTLEGVYSCRFSYVGESTYRYYEGDYKTFTSEYHPAAYTIAEKDGLELCIITIFTDRYLMGDTEGEPAANFQYDPYLAIMDQDGAEYEDPEMLGQFDAELISWNLPEPIENSFVFAGFTHLTENSLYAMLAIGLLVMVATLIFVKRDKTVPYKALDKISIVLNFAVVLLAIPFMTFMTLLLQIVLSTGDFIYQVYLCLPMLTAYTVAASVALRRTRFTKSGFFIQFVGPVLFFLPVVLDMY